MTRSKTATSSSATVDRFCPRLWKNASQDVGDVLCFSAVTVKTSVG
jgi:hypothetical protein